MKYYFQPDPSRREVRLGRFVADAVTEDGVVEVQTRSLEKLRPKLAAFLPQGPVTVVYPVAAEKTVIWVNSAGECTRPRKSPLKPTAGYVLPELYRIRDFLTCDGLRLCLLMLKVEDYRLLDGWSRDGKRGSTRFDRMPVALLDQVWLCSPGDYAQLVPAKLPEVFTSRELGKAIGRTPKKASLAANVLRGLGVIRQEGKLGSAYLYTRGSF
ncbi:MAG: hypothetical protein ACOYJZ_03110 [Acutalibacter sp.]